MANEIRIKLQPLGNLKCFIYCFKSFKQLYTIIDLIRKNHTPFLGKY